MQVNTQKAETEHAYELQSTKLQQTIRNEQKTVELVERKKLIEIQEKEIVRKEKDLLTNVNLPAESEAHKMYSIALGNRNAQITLAEAEAQRIKLLSEAEVSFENKFRQTI